MSGVRGDGPVRRGIEIAATLGGVAFFLPALLLVPLLILLDDGPPALFSQERIGFGRRPFRIWKFRTMRGGAVTRAGRILRATGLDEIPQFWNVLVGEMAAVGPRPLEARLLRRLGWDDPAYDDRFAVRPGLTGLAQLRAVEGAEASRKWDRIYLRKRSLHLDASIVAASFLVNLLGKRRARRVLYGIEDPPCA